MIWGLGHSGPSVAAAGLSLLLAGVVLLFLLRLHRRLEPLHALVFALLLAGVLLLPLAVRLHNAQSSPVATLAAARTEVSAELVVTADPRPLAAGGTGGAPRAAVKARLLAVTVSGQRHRLGGAVLVLGPANAWQQILPGQRVRLDARLSPPLPGDLLTATLSERTDPELIGRPPWWQRGAGRVRDGLRQASASLPALPRGLLPGLVVGDTSQLDPVLADRFRVAGLTHLVAVSGTNCSIVIGAAALVLRRMRASPRTIALVGAVLLVAFVVVARPSPSVLRAAVMAAIGLAALATGRQRAGVPVLAAAVLILLCWQPALALDLGFALSVSATAALMLLAPGWAVALSRRLPVGVAEPFAVAAAAHVVTMPLIVGLSGRISLVAIPANMLAEPVVGAATVLGVLAATMSVLWLPAGVLFAQLAGWPCRWLIWVAERCGTIPGASVPWPAGVTGGFALTACALLLLAGCRRASVRSLAALAVVVALVVQIPIRAVVSRWPPDGWLIVACDVGQGDSLAIRAGPHAAIVVDAGPESISPDRCLRQLGVTRIPLLVLTHFHLDHVAGLVGVLHQRTVGRTLTSPLIEPASGYQLVEKALGPAAGRMDTASTGQTIVVGRGPDEVRLDVLGPAKAFSGTRSDPNNSSLVLRATIHGRRIMLPGDAEVEAQDALLESGQDLRADILKVPHHGSAYSDPAFLRAVNPSLALVSVGRDNDYGHPSPLLLTALSQLGVLVRRTDLDGDIAVVSAGAGLRPVVHPTADAAGARAPPFHRPATTLRWRQPLNCSRSRSSSGTRSSW
ncbi:MAG: internalization-related competence protein ComEC/Rec2 [Frankiales bacterium]|nr:internalization-related competence protein ComEC/Rec2 [Frankiales bacterium]